MIPQEDGKDNAELLAKTVRVSDRLMQRMVDVLGQKWVDTWHVGLPNWFHAKYGTQHGNLVWLYNLIQAYGLLDFAKDRYSPLEPRGPKWDSDKSKDDNVAQYGPGWHWMPGCGVANHRDYSVDLGDCPAENREKLLEAVAFVHKWCQPEKKDEKSEEEPPAKKAKVERPYEWETSYDMRPWTAFPERS
eukprot:Sro1953_g307530.2  (189) ;mRNA; f:9587-10153